VAESGKESGKGTGRAHSDVLDAIFDAVETTPNTSAKPTGIFRAKALEQIDVPKQLDNLLPLTARRRWLVLLGVAILIVAGLSYSIGTTVVTSVPGTGRAVVSPGVAVAASPENSVILSVSVASGEEVAARQPLSDGTAPNGSTVHTFSPVDGTVWQVLEASGSVVAQGTPVITVLPRGPQTSALFAVDESNAKQLVIGQRVTITTGNNNQVDGTLTQIEAAPVPASNASSRVALTLPSNDGFVLVSVTADAPLTPGDGLSATFTISEQTLAQKLMSGL